MYNFLQLTWLILVPCAALNVDLPDLPAGSIDASKDYYLNGFGGGCFGLDGNNFPSGQSGETCALTAQGVGCPGAEYSLLPRTCDAPQHEGETDNCKKLSSGRAPAGTILTMPGTYETGVTVTLQVKLQDTMHSEMLAHNNQANKASENWADRLPVAGITVGIFDTATAITAVQMAEVVRKFSCGLMGGSGDTIDACALTARSKVPCYNENTCQEEPTTCNQHDDGCCYHGRVNSGTTCDLELRDNAGFPLDSATAGYHATWGITLTNFAATGYTAGQYSASDQTAETAKSSLTAHAAGAGQGYRVDLNGNADDYENEWISVSVSWIETATGYTLSAVVGNPAAGGQSTTQQIDISVPENDRASRTWKVYIAGHSVILADGWWDRPTSDMDDVDPPDNEDIWTAVANVVIDEEEGHPSRSCSFTFWSLASLTYAPNCIPFGNPLTLVSKAGRRLQESLSALVQ